MVVLEGEAGDAKQPPNEGPDKEEVKQPSLLSLESILLQNDLRILWGCNRIYLHVLNPCVNFSFRNAFSFSYGADRNVVYELQ